MLCFFKKIGAWHESAQRLFAFPENLFSGMTIPAKDLATILENPITRKRRINTHQAQAAIAGQVKLHNARVFGIQVRSSTILANWLAMDAISH